MVVTLTTPLSPPALAPSAIIVTVSPTVVESSLKLISLIQRSGSPTATTFMAEKGNINMASRRAVSLRDMGAPECNGQSIAI